VLYLYKARAAVPSRLEDQEKEKALTGRHELPLDSHSQHGVLESLDILNAVQEPRDEWSSGIGLWQGIRGWRLIRLRW
jgi:hypothetical protein